MNRQGHLKGRTGGSHDQRKGPLRRIVAVIRHGDNLFDRNRVRLECGHETLSNGQVKARCEKCIAALARIPEAKPPHVRQHADAKD